MARSLERTGLAVVLEWYRQRLTFPRWGNRKPVVVPTEYAGWVLAGAGEPADADGCRPMGLVRAELLTLLDTHIDGPARERAAFCAVWGLTEWPDMAVTRPITRRLPVQRQHRGDHGAPKDLSPERVGQLAANVLRRLDTPQALRVGARAVSAGPVPDPTSSSWLPRLLVDHRASLTSVLEDSIDTARLFLTRTGITGAVDPVLAELDRYTAVMRANPHRLSDSRRPVATSRVRALVGVAMWQVLHRYRPEFQGSLRRASLDPAAVGALRPPPVFTPVASVVALLLDGNVGTEVLAGCCDEARRLSRVDPDTAAVIVDLLLARYPTRDRPSIDPDIAARILQTAIRHRSADEDWTAIALVYLMAREHPRSHRTVDALMYAIPVATAHSRWAIAEDLLHRMALALAAGITVPAGRVVAVETVEYRVWMWHQRTATARRRLQEEGQRASQSAVQDALREQSHALHDLDLALTLNDTRAPGDASESWRHILLIRQAELQLAAADLTTGLDAEIHRRRAGSILDGAAARQRKQPALAGDSTALSKAQLSLAIRTGDDDHAAELLTDLHQGDRWPLHRTVPEVSQVAAGHRHKLVGPLLHAAVNELLIAESSGTWRSAVDSANRNRRAHAG